MRRRVMLALLAGAPALMPGATAQEILEAVEPLASALSEGNVDNFMAGIAAGANGRDDLRAAVAALIAFAEVTSSVQVASVDGERATLDWYMLIRARATKSVVERRRGQVAVRVAGRKLAEIGPLKFFAVPTERP